MLKAISREKTLWRVVPTYRLLMCGRSKSVGVLIQNESSVKRYFDEILILKYL